MIFKQETIKSLFTGVSSSVNSQIIQPFADAEQVIKKYNLAIQHNSLTQKGWERLLAQSDDSMRAYLTSIKGSTASVTGYTTSLQGNITGFKKVSSAISQYNTLSAQGVAEQKTFATAVSTTNGKLGTYLSGLKGAKASMGGYIKSLITAKAASIGLKVATIALNASFSMGISLLISKLISSITEYSERISTAAEKAGEALDTAKSNVKELNSLIKEYNDLQLSNEWDNTDIETKKQLQKDINALLDDEADKLDIVNGKYEETTAELYKQKLAKLSEQEKSAYDALEAEKDALWDENKYSNLSFKMQYSKKGEVTDYDDTDMLKEYYEKYNDVLVQWKKTNLGAQSVSMFLGTQDPKNVEELITQYDRLSQLSQEMYDNGDTGAFYDSINAYLDKLKERVKKIHGYETDFDDAQAANNLGKILTDPNNGFGGYIETLEEYQKVVDFINNSDYENKEGILDVLATDFYEFANQVENAGNSVDDFGNRITVLNFEDAFNAEKFEDTKEKLLELAKSGELSPYTLLSTKEYNSLLKQTGLTAEQAYSEIMKIAQSDMFMEDWNNTLENARSQIAKIDELLTELDDNGQTSSFVDDIISDYPQLLEYLGDEQELREQLKALQEEQEDVARKAYTQLVSDSETYYNTFKTQETERLNALNDTINTTISKNKSLVDTLGENYKIDLNNYKSITDAKAKLEMELIKNSASAWSKFYKVQVDATTGYASIIGSTTVSPSEYLDSSGDYGAAVNKFVEEQNKQKQAAQDVVDVYNSIIASLNSIVNSTNITDASGGSGGSSSSSETFLDGIEIQIDNINDELDDLQDKIDDTYSSWTDRQNKLKEASEFTASAIEIQNEALKAYETEASKIDLPQSIKDLIDNGNWNIKNGAYTGETANKIKEYQELADKIKECEKAINDLTNTQNELAYAEKWDLFKSKSDLQIENADNIIDYQQSLVDKAELQGLFANEDYYKVMRMQNLRKQSELKKQYAELETILNTVPQGTEAYDTLFNEWMDIRNQLGELENEFIEFNNNIRDLDWEIFEYLEDSISRITEEVDFLKDLLSDKDMFDEYGNMTKYADATMGLHFTNIETYKKLAEDYYGEMQELQQQLADGAGQDVLEKYHEYEDLHRDAITSIMDEKNAILDLVQNAYDEQISALERINDLTLERMDRERDLYNYQKNIAEKMKEKTSLERQISVYDGDNSEESIANTQRLKLELEKVNSDIEELQYEKQRADTEQMLTSITDNMKEWQSKRMDDEQGLLEEIKDGISTKSDEIKTTLTEVADEYGTTLSTSLSDIFDKKNPFDNVVTAINNLIDKIIGLVGGDSNSDGDSNTPADNPKPNGNTDVKQPTANNTNQPSQPIDTQSKSETDSIFIPQKSVYPKGELNKDKSATDWLKYHDYASDFSSRAIYYKKLGGSGAYTGSGTQNSWLLKKMKEVGFAKGGTIGGLIKQTGEDGFVLARTGEEIFSLDKIEALSKTFQYAQPFMSYYNTPKMPNIQPRNTSNEVNLGGVHIAQVVTSDAQDFMKQLPSIIANDTKTQKVISEVVLGGALGRNSMSAKRFL